MALSVSPTYEKQWCRACRRSVDNRNGRALFTHAGYQDELPDHLSALAEVPINRDDLSGFVYFKSLGYRNLSQRLHVLLL